MSYIVRKGVYAALKLYVKADCVPSDKKILSL